MSGKKKQIIPWGQFTSDPYSWISEECTPGNFPWKDPSHIKLADIFALLDHWRCRQDQGLNPIIWLPTCPILQSSARPIERGRTVRRQQARVQQQEESDEEVFQLPASDDVDEEDEDEEADEEDKEDEEDEMDDDLGERSDADKSTGESPQECDSSDGVGSTDVDMDSQMHLEHGGPGTLGHLFHFSIHLISTMPCRV